MAEDSSRENATLLENSPCGWQHPFHGLSARDFMLAMRGND
jgi:hypothetical protein